MPNADKVWMNGRLVPAEQAAVSVFDRSFLYGDGLFETIAVRSGRPVFWEDHLERLRNGLDRLGLRLPCTAEGLLEGARWLIRETKTGRATLRIHVSRGVGRRGYSPRGADSPLVVMTVHPADGPETAPRTWRLHTASVRVATDGILTTVKSASKLLQVLARQEAEASGAEEALVLNTHGRIAETSSGNLFWIREGRLGTPPLSEGALPGIARARLLRIAREIGLDGGETSAAPADLLDAEGVFVSLGTLGVVEVVALDGTPLLRSPWIRRLWEAYERAANADVGEV